MDSRPLIDALLTDPGEDEKSLLATLGTALMKAGVALDRLSSASLVLHPELIGRGLVWSPQTGTRDRPISYAYSLAQGPDDPVRLVIEEGVEIRVRAGEQTRFSAVRELLESGVTEYVILPVPFRGATVGRGRGFLSFATRATGGFTDEQSQLFRAVEPAFGARLALFSALQSSRGLLQIYLGSNAVDRVLRGAFVRGQGERIDAVIWYCDLRGFTAFVDGADVVPVLDRYFDAVAQPVTDRGAKSSNSSATRCWRSFLSTTAMRDLPRARRSRRLCARLRRSPRCRWSARSSDNRRCRSASRSTAAR